MPDFTGLERKMRGFGATIEAAARASLPKYADQLVAMMRQLVPEEEGALKRSIGWSWGAAPEGSLELGVVQRSAGDAEAKGGVYITIHAGNETTIVTNSRGIKFQNAFLQEFGTEERSASPFFYPVVRANTRRVKNGVNAAIRRAVRKSM